MRNVIRNFLLTLSLSLLAWACQPQPPATPSPIPLLPTLPLPSYPTTTPFPVITQSNFTPTPSRLVPNFSHIVIIIFENKEFDTVIGNRDMPYFNILADTYTLLTEHYATAHPSLPNYLSLIGGDTFGVTDDCEDCFIDATSLPDLIEQSGRTWRTYQDDMPDPCYIGSTIRYVQKHNPFIYFDPIRLNDARCKQGIVPLTQLDGDLAANALPNFVFITPDICYSAHDCGLDLTDGWLKDLVKKLVPALDSTNEPYLIVLTWDEGQSDISCCGLPMPAGGRVATILISPQAKSGFKDSTQYTHYSILKTISEAWGLPYLGHAADAETNLIAAPWK